MIQQHNYFNEVRNIDFSKLPDALKQGHDFMVEATDNGADWSAYDADAEIASTIDDYLEKLNKYLSNKEPQQGKPVKPVTPKPAPVQRPKPVPVSTRAAPAPQPVVEVKRKPATAEPATAGEIPGLVERIPEELRFIKRFVNLDGKTKTKDELRAFITGLQKAIVEKRIRKTSPYAGEVRYVQKRLLHVYNNMKAKVSFTIPASMHKKLLAVTGGEKLMPSVNFLKRYLSLQGKTGVKDKAKLLLKQLTAAVKEKGKINKSDRYAPALEKAFQNLKAFVENKTLKHLVIESRELNGLQGIFNGLDGVPETANGYEQPQIMNSMDFANMQFDTLGFTGKWLELIGDPSANFSAMVYGKPKMGKSYLCMDFAGYLARHHGPVLYVAKEEGLDYTLQEKLNDKNVKHPNLTVAAFLPENLSPYRFIFLDSVTRLNLNPEDLNRLKAAWPGKSFVFVFQSTKDGHYRGSQHFQHDVDVVIEVPEKGRAVQMGRFNQGGEMNIFPLAA
jgi:hypothetical protein